jgi:voltage-gated potassium channel
MTDNADKDVNHQILTEERWNLLQEIDTFLDKPLIALSFVWLILMILDFTEGLSPVLRVTFNIIWSLFIFDFVLELWIAPKRLEYIKKHWLTAISIALPGFRILQTFRIFQFLRLARFGSSITLMRLLTSIRRGMGAINKTLGKRGFGYMIALTTIVVFAGAAGMAYFENPNSLNNAGYSHMIGFQSYGDALWWTAMIMTTMGSDYWPKTPEGRLLCWVLALYSFTVFGYITATLASHFIQSDKESLPTNDHVTISHYPGGDLKQ